MSLGSPFPRPLCHIECPRDRRVSWTRRHEETDSDSDDPEAVLPSLKEMIKMCWIVEENSMVVCTEGALDQGRKGFAPIPRPSPDHTRYPFQLVVDLGPPFHEKHALFWGLTYLMHYMFFNHSSKRLPGSTIALINLSLVLTRVREQHNR